MPLVAYDQAIGALGIFSDNERAFDEGHLELMRVLASEASIAIENARLFQEERTKRASPDPAEHHFARRHRHPESRRSSRQITEQLENGLHYDHIGIAMLDYTTRELVIQAESGKRRGALGHTPSAGYRADRPSGAHRKAGGLSRAAK